MDMQAAIRRQVMTELQRVFAEGSKGLAGNPAGQFSTGPGGTFELPGVNRDFFSTVIQPEGLWANIPAHASMFMNPEFGYITGFTAPTGSQPTTACGDGPQPGTLVTCVQTAHYGRYRMDTVPLEINRVGQLVNAASPTDFRLVNSPLFQSIAGIVPGGAGSYASDIFNPKREVAKRMGDVAREMTELLSKQLWEGEPKAVNDATAEGSDEFPGLFTLVGTNKIDARTGTPCQALNSDIKDFGYRSITENGGTTIFNAMYYMMQTRRYIARRTNMGAVEWVWVMREGAWDELVKQWPCVFATFGCLPQGNGTITPVINLDGQARLQQDMRDGMYLPFPGQRVRVVIEDALPEEDRNAGCQASDMFLLPMSVKGGYDVLFREYLDYKQGAILGAQQAGYGPGVFQSDNGQYLWWTKPNNNVCIQMGMKTEQRVVLLAPHLAGRLNSVTYCPLQHGPDPYRDQPYYNLTGESNRGDAPDLYSDWNTSGPGVH